MLAIGDSVYAIARAEFITREDGVREYHVYSYGGGVYLGDRVPDGTALVPGSLAAMLADKKVPNPCIQLASGDVVYGCECWWGGVANATRRLCLNDPATVVHQESIEEHRAAALSAKEETPS
jgi:hypothetical protein